MKKIFLSLITLVATMSINAQVVKVYDTKISTTEPVGTYKNSDDATYKVVFQELSTKKGTTADEHEWVDLGLPSGTMWATCNVGASKPEEYGNYYAWGETTTKTTYSWATYKHCNGTQTTLNKYCTTSSYGTVDNKKELEAEDDAATVNWGSNWCMPSKDQIEELVDYTTTTWTTVNGVKGYLFTSNLNGNFIFLPAAGSNYSSSVSNAGNNGIYSVRTGTGSFYIFSLTITKSSVRTVSCNRNAGISVRPVLKEQEYVEIGGLKWATMNLGATTVAGSPSTCYGDYYAWGETEPRYTSITISGDGKATYGGWSSSHSQGYSEDDYPTYTGTTLDAAHDAATQNCGSNWHTPTNADFQALAKACNGSTSKQNISAIATSEPTGGIYWLAADQNYLSVYTGVAGVLFVDKTDTSKRVFFPAAGAIVEQDSAVGGSNGDYWSSTYYSTDGAFKLNFGKTAVVPSDWDNYCWGYPIRPVSE